MKKKTGFNDKRKVVTFQLVNRSIEDPLNADPNASEHVLVPIHIGSDVREDMVKKLEKQMQPAGQPAKRVKQTEGEDTEKRGIGAEYNKLFGDFPDDGYDYTQHFKVIDEENDDGVFIAPDGTVHDLKKHEVKDVDQLIQAYGFDSDMFGTDIDPDLPKLVDDTGNPLGGVDLDILLAMDDDDAPPLEDDFVAKALAAENEEDQPEDDDSVFNEYDDDDELPGFDTKSAKSAKSTKSRTGRAMSRTSETPSHMSRISHRSDAMDYVEEKVEYLMSKVYGEEEDMLEEEEEDLQDVDWDDIMADFQQYTVQPRIKLNPETGESKEENTNTDEPKPEKTGPRVTFAPEAIVPPEDSDSDIDDLVSEPAHFDVMPIHQAQSGPKANVPVDVPVVNKKPKKSKKKQEEADEDENEQNLPDQLQPKPGETQEERKARKKAIKEFNRQRRQAKKDVKQKFVQAKKKVKKSIAGAGATRGQRVINLD